MVHDRFSRRNFISSLALAATSSALCFCGRKRDDSHNAAGCSVLAGKRIRWIVPHEAGGSFDTLSRIIADHLATALDAQVFVETRGGAGGLIGAQQIRDAKADGLTLGIINASGLMAPMLAGDHTVPNVLTEFTTLCRVARSRHIWATAATSQLKTADDVLRLSRTRPVIFPVNDVGSVAFMTTTLTAHVLDMPIQIVPGYEGSRSSALAVLRGEADVIATNLDSVFAQIKSGELRILLQVSDEPLSTHPAFNGVSLFGGPAGLAASRARSQGRNVEMAQADAHAIATWIGAGRLVVAPRGMDRSLSMCLTEKLKQVANSEAVQSLSKATELSIDVVDGETALAELAGLGQQVDRFIPVIEAAIERIRQ